MYEPYFKRGVDGITTIEKQTNPPATESRRNAVAVKGAQCCQSRKGWMNA